MLIIDKTKKGKEEEIQKVNGCFAQLEEKNGFSTVAGTRRRAWKGKRRNLTTCTRNYGRFTLNG